MSAPKVGALFAGYGGIELALHEVFGAEPAWFSEFDKAPSRILEHRYPGVPNHGDVTNIDWNAVEPVDIITGGSPCQDLSHAGKRAGMKAGTRSGLWASMCDAIDIIRPGLVVWENVRGALSATADSAVEPCPICVGDGRGVTLRALGRVLGDLAELGYDAAWTGLRAADVGAPHGRFRVFVLAWPASDAEGWGGPHGQERGGTARLDVRAVTGAAGRVDARGTAARVPVVGRDAAELAAPLWGSREWRALTLMPTPTVSDTNGAGAHGNGGLDLRTAVSLMPTPTAMDCKGSGGGGDTNNLTLTDVTERADRRGVDFGQYAPAITRWESLTRPAPPPTEPTGKGGAHRLSSRFVEWMQGLAAGWVTDVPGISRNDELKALGNGVVPQQCAAAVRHLLTIRDAAREQSVA